MKKFILEIEMGNDAMQSHRDVARALARVKSALLLTRKNEGVIADVNGNTVGRFRFETDAPKET